MESTLKGISALEASFDTQLIGSKGDSLKEFRTASFESFKTLGFPGKRTEAYKYSPVDKFIEKNVDFLQVNGSFNLSQKEVQEFLYDLPGSHLVIANGEYRSDLSKVAEDIEAREIEGKAPASLGQLAKAYHDAFAALNGTFFQHGLTIQSSNTRAKATVFLYRIFDLREGQIIAQPRLNVSLGANCELDIIEKLIFIGEGNLLHNAITEISVGKNAKINLTKNQVYRDNHIVIDGIYAQQDRDSKAYFNTFAFSGAMVRNNLNIAQEDENCESFMNGLYLLNGSSHVDNNTAIDHKKPHSYSNELYKGIVDERSRGVFNGKIYVRPGAQQTNAFQSNNNISLSDTATVNTKPQLEIWADDVKCSHGCTIGQLDEDAIFYLRARGLSEISAKAMLLVAFAENTLDHIPAEQVKDEVSEIIVNRLTK